MANYPNADLRDDALLELSDINLTWLQDNLQTIAYARQLIAQHPTSPLVPLAILNIGLAKANTGDKAAAEQEYRKVLKEYANFTEESAKALDLLCDLLPAEECSKLIEEFRTKNPKASGRLETVSFNAARDLYYDGDLNAALRQLNNYISDYPNGQHYYEALLLRGEIHEQQGRKEAALEDYAEIYDHQTAGESIAQALLNAARLSVEEGKLEEAISLFERAETKAASVFDRRAAQFERGEALMQLERYADAEKLYTQILGEEEVTEFSQSRAQLALGKVQYALEKKDSALTRFEQVATANQNKFGAEAQYFVAKILNEQGKYKQSEEAVYAARDRFPNYGEWLAKTYLVMVENYLASDKRLNAIETLKSLVENAPTEAIKTQAQERLQQMQADAPESELRSTDGMPTNPELENYAVDEMIEEEE
ncbi:MAG: tetratricopeptide repeat protein [Bacteroidota bacterium]